MLCNSTAFSPGSDQGVADMVLLLEQSTFVSATPLGNEQDSMAGLA
jgi:hypothetical protein